MGFWARLRTLFGGGEPRRGASSHRGGSARPVGLEEKEKSTPAGSGEAAPEAGNQDAAGRLSDGDVLDPSKPMTAPEVPLREQVPSCVSTELDTLLHQECWSLLLVPEEEFTRWFSIFADSLRELGRTPIAEHDDYLERLHTCAGGAISLADGKRFRIEDSRSFNEFGDRYTLQFFEEGAFTCDQSTERRRSNIRLVNRLKPADALTAKNEESLARAVLRVNLEEAYLDSLVKHGLLSEEKKAQISSPKEELLSVMRSINIPRKMASIALAECMGIDYLEVGSEYYDKAATHLVSEEWKSTRNVFPFIIEKGKLKVAMADPTDTDTIKALEQIAKVPARVYCSAARDIEYMIKKAHKDD